MTVMIRAERPWTYLAANHRQRKEDASLAVSPVVSGLPSVEKV
jgi:hypothetical protein